MRLVWLPPPTSGSASYRAFPRSSWIRGPKGIESDAAEEPKRINREEVWRLSRPLEAPLDAAKGKLALARKDDSAAAARGFNHLAPTYQGV